MKSNKFQISLLPQIVFGNGVINEVPKNIIKFGKNALIVTGAKSFRESNHWSNLQIEFKNLNIESTLFHVSDEPSVKLVDQAVSEFTSMSIMLLLVLEVGVCLMRLKRLQDYYRMGIQF